MGGEQKSPNQKESNKTPANCPCRALLHSPKPSEHRSQSRKPWVRRRWERLSQPETRVTASSLCLSSGSPPSIQILQSQGCFCSVIPLTPMEAGLCSLQNHVLMAASICRVYVTSCCPPSSLLPSCLSDNTKHPLPGEGHCEQTLSSKAQERHIPTLPPTPKKKTGTQILAGITKYMAPIFFPLLVNKSQFSIALGSTAPEHFWVGQPCSTRHQA